MGIRRCSYWEIRCISSLGNSWVLAKLLIGLVIHILLRIKQVLIATRMLVRSRLDVHMAFI